MLGNIGFIFMDGNYDKDLLLAFIFEMSDVPDSDISRYS